VWLGVRIGNREDRWATWRQILLNSFIRTLPWGIALGGIVVGVLWLVVGPRYRAYGTLRITEYSGAFLALPESAPVA
jgi:thiamine transporter ThiT